MECSIFRYVRTKINIGVRVDDDGRWSVVASLIAAAADHRSRLK